LASRNETRTDYGGERCVGVSTAIGKTRIENLKKGLGSAVEMGERRANVIKFGFSLKGKGDQEGKTKKSRPLK